jgi:hypothetical protein
MPVITSLCRSGRPSLHFVVVVGRHFTLGMADPSAGVQWFTTENLEALSYDTPEEMIELLQSRALAEGFRLCCMSTKSNNWNKLRCFRHEEAGEGCTCRIGIQVRTKPNRHCVVSKHQLCHNHQHDALVFAHLCLPHEVEELIKVFGRLHCRPELVADYLREDRHVQLSSYQVSAIMYENRAPAFEQRPRSCASLSPR